MTATPSLAPAAFDYPLADFQGRRPPAPAWFDAALAREPERSVVMVDGGEIEVLAWGQRGRPGLLFTHGAAAHADWWSFIAPYFDDDFRVVAYSLSGMGRSEPRERYSIAGFADEAFAVAEAAGLYDSATKPVLAGHSFGGRAVLRAAADPRGAGWKGAIVLDTLIPVDGAPRPSSPFNGRPVKTYATQAEALARFRLLPQQPCENLFILDHIARHGMTQVDPADPESGWRWRFDPHLFERLEPWDTRQDLAAAVCPVAMIYGALSSRAEPAILRGLKALAPGGTPFVSVPEARHHLMLDQPLAVATALRTLLAAWPATAD